jgi:hypothetical protein
VVMYDAMAAHVAAGHGRVTVVGTAAMTNLALLVSLYTREELERVVERLVLLGGAVTRGNVSAHTEFNAHVDPEAMAIVLRCGLPITLVPLEVTHTCALVTPRVFAAFTDDRACAELLAALEAASPPATAALASGAHLVPTAPTSAGSGSAVSHLTIAAPSETMVDGGSGAGAVATRTPPAWMEAALASPLVHLLDVVASPPAAGLPAVATPDAPPDAPFDKGGCGSDGGAPRAVVVPVADGITPVPATSALRSMFATLLAHFGAAYQRYEMMPAAPLHDP